MANDIIIIVAVVAVVVVVVVVVVIIIALCVWAWSLTFVWTRVHSNVHTDRYTTLGPNYGEYFYFRSATPVGGNNQGQMLKKLFMF